MKKILLLLSACFCLSGCGWMVLGAAAVAAPDPSFSFWAHGEYFKADESLPGTFRIMEVEGKGFAISYGGSNWETDNEIEEAKIGLNCGFFDGELEKGMEYCFNSDDRLDTYPYFSHIYREAVELNSGSEIYHTRTVWYNAVEGWFKITKINKKKGIISGRFEFTAVKDDPSSYHAIEVTNGVFRDIPYIVVSDK